MVSSVSAGGAEQQVVKDRLVLIGDRGDFGRQGEAHVEVVDRQQIGLAGGEPVLRRRALTLGAMAVAARVVGDPAVAAILAALYVAAEGGRATVLDGRHHLELTQAHMLGIGSAPSGPMVMMKDVRDLQPRAAHRRRLHPLSGFLLGKRREPVERADHGADRGIGDAGV